MLTRPALLAVLLTVLSGCDQLGIESPAVAAEKRTAEGKATGAACRHAGRAIEDCYTLNKKAERAAIYAGWREMDDYMRENKLEPVVPVIKPEEPKPKPKPAAEGEETEVLEGKEAVKDGAKDAKADKKHGAH